MQNAQQAGIIAAAAGVIIAKENGNYDHNCALGSGNWNAVYVGNADGTICWYGHMQNGTQTTKAVGQSVAQGEFLGFVGSSGNSTGPHLHFEVHDNNGNILDPYSGPCNNNTSMWQNQKPYYEPTINALLTQSAPAVYGPCPAIETINAKDSFHIGNNIVFASYFHDQDDNLVSYEIISPSNTVFYSWTYSLNPGVKYSSSYAYWSNTITAAMDFGQWKFKATYMGNTVTKKFWVIDPLSVDKVSNNEVKITISPNPSQGQYTITGLSEQPHNYTLTLRDALGKTVSEQNHKDVRNELTYNVEAIPGIYFLTLQSNEGKTHSIKLVKMP